MARGSIHAPMPFYNSQAMISNIGIKKGKNKNENKKINKIRKCTMQTVYVCISVANKLGTVVNTFTEFSVVLFFVFNCPVCRCFVVQCIIATNSASIDFNIIYRFSSRSTSSNI